MAMTRALEERIAKYSTRPMTEVPITERMMPVEWCLGRAVGDRAKSVLDHSSAGMGYFVMESGKQQGNQLYVLFAYLRPLDGPIPDHINRVTDPHMLRKLDERHAKRHGTQRMADRRGMKAVSAQQIADVAKIMGRGEPVERKDIT